MDRYARLDTIARAQQGCWSLRQAVEAGFPRQTVDGLVERGTWGRLRRGVFTAAGMPPSWLRDLWAAYLALPDSEPVVARRSAARLWELPGFDRTPALELAVPRDHTPRLAGATVKRTIHLPPHDVTVHSGLRITSVTRTLHDLAAVTRMQQLLLAAAEGYRLGRTDPMRLLASIRARPGLPGNRRLRETIGHLDERFRRTRSVAEIVALVVLRELGLPPFDVNVRLKLTNGRRVEVDVLFAERHVLEINGARYHGSVLQRRADAARRADLEADGYVVRELWADELHDRARVHAVVTDLLAADPVGTSA